MLSASMRLEGILVAVRQTTGGTFVWLFPYGNKQVVHLIDQKLPQLFTVKLLFLHLF